MSADPNSLEAPARKTGTVVAVDGPSASGKSTVSRTLAARLGLPYVNTGLMYRALAARAIAAGVSPDDGPALTALARSIVFSLAPGASARVLEIDGRRPGPELSSPDVEAIVSAVSRHPAVRALMRSIQRRLGASGAVMEGRDIGSVVFPDADVKLFVWADPSVRVARRERERGAVTPAEEAAIAQALARRDELDAKTNPMEPSPGAVVIDTTDMTADVVAERAYALARAALGRALDAAPNP